MSLKTSLLNCIPDAYYSDGVKATCIAFRICNMFDIDSYSFKEVKKIKVMDKIKISNSDTLQAKSVQIDNLILDGHKIGIENGKLVVKK